MSYKGGVVDSSQNNIEGKIVQDAERKIESIINPYSESSGIKEIANKTISNIVNNVNGSFNSDGRYCAWKFNNGFICVLFPNGCSIFRNDNK